MPSFPISLCMIVRNEEKYLPACLQSVCDLVSEIVLVDTGSTDQTKEIAHSFGALVIDFPWINDFAAARNVAVNAASQPWILQLDADEELLPGARHWLSNSWDALSPAAYKVTIHNLRDVRFADIMASHMLIRFFCNRPDMRYVNRIHENVIIPLDIEVKPSRLEIIHKGYGDHSRKQEKSERNRVMLLDELRNQPNNAITHYYLAQQCFNAADWQGMVDHATKALELNLPDALVQMCWRYLFFEAHRSTDLNRLDVLLRQCPDYEKFPDRLYFESFLLDKKEQKQEALQKVNAFLAWANDLFQNNPGAYRHLVLPDIHRAALLLRISLSAERPDSEATIADLNQASALAPSDWRLRLRLTQAYMNAKDHRNAVLHLNILLDLLGKQPDIPESAALIRQFTPILAKLNDLLQKLDDS